MVSIVRHWLPQAAAMLPLDWLHRSMGARVVFPYYHLVTNEPAPHVENLYQFRNVRAFEADLGFFLRHFTPISAGTLLDALEGMGTLPRHPFLLSFDDGFREMHDIVAPILLRLGVPAVFFLNSAMHDNQELCLHQKISLLIDASRHRKADFPAAEVLALLRHRGVAGPDVEAALRAVPWAKRSLLDQIAELCECDFPAFLRERQPYLTTPQVRSMVEDGFEIGGHSIDHPLYAELDPAEQLRQTRESMAFVQEKFYPRRRLFAFPHTDRGVSHEFFSRIFQEKTAEATFGTAAPARDCVTGSFQRFTMEKTTLPARGIFSRLAVRTWKARLTGKGTLRRAA